jgi:hypothetical protein
LAVSRGLCCEAVCLWCMHAMAGPARELSALGLALL